MDKHTIMIVGCGGMAGNWFSYAKERENCEIAACVDLVEANAEKYREKFELDCPVFTDVKKAHTKVDADIVFDVTVPAARYEVVTTSLDAGCHVFSEKPMANSLDEAEKLVAAADRAGRVYAIMQNRRYLKTIRAYRDLVQSDIGKSGMINCDFFLGPGFEGFRSEMNSPLLLDMAIHTFDQARFIQNTEAVSVYATEFNIPGSWYNGDASAVSIFDMADGSKYIYRGSWSARGVNTSWEGHWRVLGEKGTAIWDSAEGKNRVWAEIVPGVRGQEPKAEKQGELTWKGREGHFGCLDDMFDAIHNGTKPMTDCTDNIKSIKMVFGAIESARHGKKIRI